MNTLRNALTRIEQGQVSQQDLELIVRFARQAAGSGVEDLMVANHLFHLVQAVTEIASALELEPIAQITAARALDFINADSCVFLRWDEKQARLTRSSQVDCPAWSEIFPWPGTVALGEVEFLRAALEKQEPVQADVSAPAFPVFFQHTDVARALVIPVANRGALLGLLVILMRGVSEPIRTTDQVYLRLLANAAAVSMEHAMLYEAERQHTRELEAVHRASLTLTASLDLQQVLDAILQSIFSLVQDTKDAHIFLYDGQSLRFGAALWWNGRRDMLVAPRENGITYTVARQGESIVVKDMRQHELYQNAPRGWSGSIISMPLKIGLRVVGVMNVARVEDVGYTPAELRLLRLLADQAAMAIENARLHDLMQHQALTDSLTGLPNRRFFDQRLNEEIRRSVRYHHPFALVMMDLDNFKEINDRFGHPAGDSVLKQVANLFHAHLNDTDFLARYGGDEFSFILPETSEETVLELIARMQYLLNTSEFLLAGNQTRSLSGSFGFALFPASASSSDELISLADQRLYAAKHQGK